MGWHKLGYQELGHCAFRGSGRCSDGRVGQEEGEAVQKGIRCRVQEEEVRHDSWDILRSGGS